MKRAGQMLATPAGPSTTPFSGGTRVMAKAKFTRHWRTLQEMIGKTFNGLTVVAQAPAPPVRGSRRRYWLCSCVCGRQTTVRGDYLCDGHTKSCGCLHEFHGRSHSSEYGVWQRMIQRCINPKNRRFDIYGGRGITVCDRWLASFAAFLADMGPRPSSKHSIDRIDNDGHYEPGNCRWATAHEQARNKRNNRLLTHDGKTLCLQGWAEQTKIHSATIATRLDMGWSIEEALTIPSTPRRRRKTS
jgi:hypothetical protein